MNLFMTKTMFQAIKSTVYGKLDLRNAMPYFKTYDDSGVYFQDLPHQLYCNLVYGEVFETFTD